MPNHVFNIIEFYGPENKIAEMKEDIGSERQAIDFTKIMPVPKFLEQQNYHNVDAAVGIFMLMVNPATVLPEKFRTKGYIRATEKRFRKILKAVQRNYYRHYSVDVLDEISEADVDALYKEGKRYVLNAYLCGATWPYEWAIQNWGTKWNPYDINKTKNGFSFYTANCMPYGLLEYLAEHFPEITVSFTSFDTENYLSGYYYRVCKGKELLVDSCTNDTVIDQAVFSGCHYGTESEGWLNAVSA